MKDQVILNDDYISELFETVTIFIKDQQKEISSTIEHERIMQMEKDIEIENLKAELSSQKDSLEEQFSYQISKIGDEKESLSVELGLLKESTKEEISRLRVSLQTFESERTKLMEDFYTEKVEIEKKIVMLEQEKQESIRALEEKHTNDMKYAKTRYSEEIEILRHEIDLLRSSHEDELRKLRQYFQAEKTQNDLLKLQQAQENHLNENTENHKRELERMQQKIMLLENRLNQQSMENERLRSENDSCASDNRKLLETVRNFEQTPKNTFHEENEALKQQITKLSWINDAEIKKLREENDRLLKLNFSLSKNRLMFRATAKI